MSLTISLFYYPERDMFFIGDVNQMKNPVTPVRLIYATCHIYKIMKIKVSSINAVLNYTKHVPFSD